jgi:uncharacterized DUF497 family protein
MEVVWDSRKAASNVQKHGVSFADAATALDDPHGLTIEDLRYGEQRFVTLGTDALGRLLVVVYAYPPHARVIRLISARRATPSQRKQYHGESR